MREGNPLSVVRKERQRLESRILELEAEVVRLQKEKEEFYERLAGGRIPGWVLEWFVHVSSDNPVP